MKIQGEHQFRASREQVWQAIQDPQMLANALPGVKRLEETGPDEYLITVAVGVGSIKGTYEGTFTLSDKQELESCRVRAAARGGPGSVDAAAHMHLSDGTNGAGAAMTYEADAKVTGPLAGVGQRMIGAAAKRTTKEFLDALDRRIVEGAPAAPEAEAAPVAAGAPAERPKVFAPAAAPAPSGGVLEGQALTLGASVLFGFVLALIGVAFGRRLARHLGAAQEQPARRMSLRGP
jgi:carbon monoxide dehydrogenase subunit G